MKQATLGGFFKGTPLKGAPAGTSSNRASELGLSSAHVSSDEEQDAPRTSSRPRKRKSVVPDLASSDDGQPASTDQLGHPKKPRYSIASSLSCPATPGNLSEDGGELLEDNEHDAGDLPTLARNGQAGKTSGFAQTCNSLMTTAERSRAERLEAQDKQSPWAFLRNVKDADGKPTGSPEYDPRTLYISKKDWAMMTPFEVQFWEIKKNHFDTVLFFQKGKFSELYEDDAMIGHREFDLKITKRVKMSMVGVPETSVDFWIAKFLAKGYKVGKVDQCETALGAEMRNKGTLPASKDTKAPPKPKVAGKEVVRRELRSVVTSGTIVDGSILPNDSATCLMAIKENISASGTPTFGVIIMDAATAEFNLAHFEDSPSRTHLETIMSRFRPKEILHEKSGLSTATLRILKNNTASDCTWTALKAEEFLDVDECVCALTEMYQEKGGEIPEAITSSYSHVETIQALGGLIWYLRQLNLDRDLFTCKNVKILDPFSCSKTMQLDGKTISDLELLQSDGGEESRLSKLLNRCITPFGKRLFRHWLCSPLRNSREIQERLDAVEYLMGSPAVEQAFGAMKGLPDLERIISRIHAGACTVPNFLQVIRSYGKVDSVLGDIRESTPSGSAVVLENLLQSLPDTRKYLGEVEEMFVLGKDGKELFPLDGKDEAYDSAVEEERQAQKALAVELNAARKLLKTEDVVYKDIGIKDIYQIQVPSKVKVPNNWIKMSGTKDCARYYSPQSSQLVKRLKQAREKKSCALRDFHLKVFVFFDRNYAVWLRITKIVAELDCLLALAKASVALGEPVCRPEIVDSPEAMLQFTTLRHPCTMGRDDGDFIANDVVVGGQESRMILLTGPNMAGKSTLLRMTCVAVIMAQLGCYVPADSARISPADRICTRMGASDHIFAHASTFKVEMDDARKILTEATSKSLVILDELGRGTSTFDGHAIAFSVLHRLATHSNCLGFFATHYSTLAEDFALHPNIAPKFMLTNVDEETREVVFLYKLASGVSPRSYGPHVAKMAGIPTEIVQRAIKVSEEFERESQRRQSAIQARHGHRMDLVVQADTAYLLKLVKGGFGKSEAVAAFQHHQSARNQLKTLERIRKGIRSSLKP